MTRRTLLTVSTLLALAAPAAASPEYKCKDNRVEKSGSTKFTIRRSGTDFTIEKSGSTKAKVVKRGSKMSVEVSGSTKATIERGKIYKSGSTWGSTSDAQRQFECDETVAGSLWVLFKLGILP